MMSFRKVGETHKQMVNIGDITAGLYFQPGDGLRKATLEAQMFFQKEVAPPARAWAACYCPSFEEAGGVAIREACRQHGCTRPRQT
jgi:hypothetical protein